MPIKSAGQQPSLEIYFVFGSEKLLRQEKVYFLGHGSVFTDNQSLIVPEVDHFYFSYQNLETLIPTNGLILFLPSSEEHVAKLFHLSMDDLLSTDGTFPWRIQAFVPEAETDLHKQSFSLDFEFFVYDEFDYPLEGVEAYFDSHRQSFLSDWEGHIKGRLSLESEGQDLILVLHKEDYQIKLEYFNLLQQAKVGSNYILKQNHLALSHSYWQNTRAEIHCELELRAPLDIRIGPGPGDYQLNAVVCDAERYCFWGYGINENLEKEKVIEIHPQYFFEHDEIIRPFPSATMWPEIDSSKLIIKSGSLANVVP